jgi:hypothetical protein
VRGELVTEDSSPPWAFEIGTLSALLRALEDVLAVYVGHYGRSRARELLEGALIEVSGRESLLLSFCRELSEEERDDLVGGEAR